MKTRLLNGKSALITGASRGIGRVIAFAMIDAGARVIVTYKKNRKMAEEITNYTQTGNVMACQLDVTLRSSIRKLEEKIKQTYGKIDILVNNAGINKPNDFDKINDEDWNDVLETNLSGPFKVTQELLPLINNNGSIINISSVSGQYGGPRTTHYAVSKAGLISLTQNLAIFCAPRGIRVNAVAAGLIESEMAHAANSLGIAEKILLKRLGKPEEVAHAVVFLASDQSSYITAQTINVNGGLYF